MTDNNNDPLIFALPPEHLTKDWIIYRVTSIPYVEDKISFLKTSLLDFRKYLLMTDLIPSGYDPDLENWIERQIEEYQGTKSYESIKNKDPLKKKEIAFGDLFTSVAQKESIVKAMFDLGITNKEGISVLTPRNKSKLWGFIIALRDSKVIPDHSDSKLAMLFCEFIKEEYSQLKRGSGIYEKSLEKTKKHLQDLQLSDKK